MVIISQKRRIVVEKRSNYGISIRRVFEEKRVEGWYVLVSQFYSMSDNLLDIIREQIGLASRRSLLGMASEERQPNGGLKCTSQSNRGIVTH